MGVRLGSTVRGDCCGWFLFVVFLSSRRRHTRFDCDWSSECSSDLPVKINVLESIAKIWGQVAMPEGFKGQLLNVQVSYGDAVDGSKKTINSSLNIRPAKDDEEYTQGIRNSLISEFAYYQGLEDYYKQLAAGKFKEATKTMNQLSSNAQQTQRADIIESTKRLSEQHEQTLRLGGGTENTNRLLKEAASESTKRTRGK